MGTIVNAPRTVDIGQNLNVVVNPVAMSDYNARLGYGIGYLVQEDVIIKRYAWKKYSASVPTNQNSTLSMPVTKEMYDRQAKQQSIFFYIQDSGSRKIVSGAGGCRTSRFNVTVPGITPAPGTIKVARRIVGGTVFVDIYESGGLLTYAHYEYGGTTGNVFHEFFRSYIRHMRISLFCSRSISEQDWLLKAGVTIVPDDWQASDGVVAASECVAVGRRKIGTRPSSLGSHPSLLIELWTITTSINTPCGSRPADHLRYTAPATLTIDGIHAETKNLVHVSSYSTPERNFGSSHSSALFDLRDSYALWKHIIPKDSITARITVPEVTIDDCKMPAVSVEHIIPATDPIQPPQPIICQTSGSFSNVPKIIPFNVTDPLTLDLRIRVSSCVRYFASAGTTGHATTSAIRYTTPVTLSVNDIPIGTVTANFASQRVPEPGIYSEQAVWSDHRIDLKDSYALWKHTLQTAKSITFKAQIPETTIGDHTMLALSAEQIIPVVYKAECTEDTVITCEDGSEVTTHRCTGGKLVPTGEVCPDTPAGCTEGAFKSEIICPDGSRIYLDKCVDGVWVDSGEGCPDESGAKTGDKRLPAMCRDGSTIYQEVFVDGTWIPSGATCPEDLPKRTMLAAVPKIMYEGQVVDIIAGIYIGAAPSTDETATLTIDDVAVSQMNTKAGEVTFRWTAAGVGMHDLCITIPANENSPTPGRVCKTIMVSADIGSIKERVKIEMDAYNEELETLRKKKQLVREELKKYVRPGRISFPAYLAGAIIEIGGVPRTVPPGGTTIPIPAGDHQIVTTIDGIRKIIRVIVLPGEEVFLP